MRNRDFRSNSHLAFLLDLFRSKKRVDNRGWEELRGIEIRYDGEFNTSFVSLGKTRVMCSLEAEIAAPRKSARPGAGSITFSMEFLPFAHPASIDSNSHDSEAEQCLVILESLFRDTYCIDFDTLCIETNKFVFDIKCMLKVLDYDGGIWDCCTLAVSSAITHFRRSDVAYNPTTKTLTFHSTEKPPIPLTVYYRPITTTFGFIHGIAEPIVDPNQEESMLVDGYLIVGTNHRDEICLIYQCGSLSVTPETIERCCDLALKNVKGLTKFLTFSQKSDGNNEEEKEKQEKNK